MHFPVLCSFFLLAFTEPEEDASSMKEAVPAFLLLAGGHGFGNSPSRASFQTTPSNLSPLSTWACLSTGAVWQFSKTIDGHTTTPLYVSKSPICIFYPTCPSLSQAVLSLCVLKQLANSESPEETLGTSWNMRADLKIATLGNTLSPLQSTKEMWSVPPVTTASSSCPVTGWSCYTSV